MVLDDDRTLERADDHPRADFPALLADPVASVLKRENVVRIGGVDEFCGHQ